MRRNRIALTIALLAGLALTDTAFAGYMPAKRHSSTMTATEVEWHIKLSRTSVPAGAVTFDVHNAGKLLHQFIVLRTTRAAAKLPMKGTEVNLKAAGTVAGELKSIAPGKTDQLKVTLQSGRYVLLCNMPAHYKQGQFAAFRVT